MFTGSFIWARPLRLFSVTILASAAWSAGLQLTTLQPGVERQISQALTINVVFVGYQQGVGPQNIKTADFLAQLPKGSRPIVRSPAFYGIKKPLPLSFQYNYNVSYANSAFEDALFAYLSSIATPQPLTFYQSAYNSQPQRSRTVANNHWIDAPSVEKWLATNALLILGVDTSKYTVFFIDWFGRADFKRHVYTKTDDPDPDTGYNFGKIRESRKIIAWGGTPQNSTRRVWFHDLSAGPESNTANYDIVTKDLDGNGGLDYRMPPIWEYGSVTGYRPFNDLSGDLAKILR